MNFVKAMLVAGVRADPVLLIGTAPMHPSRLRSAKGLNEAGYVEGQNVTVEYHWLEGQFDHLPALMADVVRRRVAVIATPAGNYAAQVAKAATTTIPIVFGVGEDPVKLGLVANLAPPGGNPTGINFFASELEAKRLALLHELVPKAVRIAVLVNPANAPTTESELRAISDAANAMGLQIQVFRPAPGARIEAAFATLARDRAESPTRRWRRVLYEPPPSMVAYARSSCSNHTGIVGQQYAASDSRTQPNIKSPGCLAYGRSDLRPI